MRELTEYEKQKWFDEYDRFEAPEFLSYGDEVGEAYDALVNAEDCGTYLPDELVVALQIGILNMYYYQMAIYPDEYGGYDTVESLGLPPHDLMHKKLLELQCEDWNYPEPTDKMREAWDWAMNWREVHKQETEDRLLAQRLRKELERLEKRSAS